MVKIKGLIILLFCFLYTIEAESRQIGNYTSTAELEQQLEQSNGQERVILLLRISSRYNRTDINRARELAEEALSLASAFDQDSLIAESNLHLGYISLLEEKSAEALDNYIKAIEIFDDFDFKLREGTALTRIGQLYSELGNYPEALENYYEALEIFRENNGANGELDVLLRISMALGERGEMESALNYAEQTIEFAENIQNKMGMSMALSQAAAIEKEQRNIDNAISYYERAMEVLEEMGSSHGAVAVMLDLSDLYEGNTDYSKAISLNNEVYEFAKANRNNVLLIESMFNFSRILHTQGDFEASNDTLFSAQRIINESGLEIMETLFLLLISDNYKEIGDYDEAITYADAARLSAEELGDLGKIEDALITLISLYQQDRDYSKAFETQQSLLVIRDSIYSKENAEQIARMQARYEINEREKEIALLQTQNKQKATSQLYMGIGLILVLLTGFFVVRSQRLKIKSSNTELEISKLKREELKRDLEFKNKQLTTQSLNMVQKNEMMEEIKQKIDTLKEGGSSRELNSIAQLVDYSANLDEDWKQFQMHFEEVHSSFYHILKDRYPDLTPNEMRLSALVKLNLTIKEMAAILGISPDSVKTARYRLRKKLDINTEDNLSEFMLGLEKESLEVN